MRTLETEIHIDARPSEVWDVLTDFGRHGEWNPFMTRIEGQAVTGTRLRVTFRPPGRRAMTMRPVLTAVEPGRRLEWLGSLGVRGLFDGRHSFELSSPDGATTVLRHREEFTGLLVPLVWGSLRGPTLAGFEAFNTALAARCAAARPAS